MAKASHCSFQTTAEYMQQSRRCHPARCVGILRTTCDRALWQAAADSLNLSIAWDIDEATAHLCGEHVSTPAIIMIDGGACSFASVQKPAMKSLQHCFRDRVYKAQLQ